MGPVGLPISALSISAHATGSYLTVSIMVQLPPLPTIETPWSPNIRNAFLLLNTIYSTASTYLETGSIEPHRLDKYAAAVVSYAFPLLLLLDESAEEENLSLDWLEKVSNSYVEILVLLDENLECARGEYVKFLFNAMLILSLQI